MKEELISFETAKLAKEKGFNIKLKRGDKHPNKNLIFYQYHHPYFKETNGEVWLTPEEFNKRRLSHNKSSKSFRTKNPIEFLVINTLQRGKKYNNNNITVDFIKLLWDKQAGKCYWFNVDMILESSGSNKKRNPLKVTIDRLDNSIGYTKDNVVLACYSANVGRANTSVVKWKIFINTLYDGLSKISKQ